MTVDAGEHVGLAVSAARRYGRDVPEPEAVLEAAFLALLSACRTFDPARGSWAGYASAAVGMASRIEAGRQFRAPRPEPLYRVTREGEEIEREDLPAVDPHDGAGLMSARLLEEVGRLDPRSREVLEARYGLTGEPATYREIGERIGRCPERVRQLEARALRQLRRKLTRPKR